MRLRLRGELNTEFSSNDQFFRYKLEKAIMRFMVGYCVWAQLLTVAKVVWYYNFYLISDLLVTWNMILIPFLFMVFTFWTNIAFVFYYPLVII